jgi:hypothetical protein
MYPCVSPSDVLISGHLAVYIMTFKLDQSVCTFNIHVSVYLPGKQARHVFPSCSSVNAPSLIIAAVCSTCLEWVHRRNNIYHRPSWTKHIVPGWWGGWRQNGSHVETRGSAAWYIPPLWLVVQRTGGVEASTWSPYWPQAALIIYTWRWIDWVIAQFQPWNL